MVTPQMPTAPQQIAVLEALQRGPSCLHEFGPVAYVARNRVGDLRRLGWRIVASPCRRHAHHGRVAEYRLVREGAQNPEPGMRASGTRPHVPGSPYSAFPEAGPSSVSQLRSGPGVAPLGGGAAPNPVPNGMGGAGHGAQGDPATPFGTLSGHETARAVLTPELFPAPYERGGAAL